MVVCQHMQTPTGDLIFNLWPVDLSTDLMFCPIAEHCAQLDDGDRFVLFCLTFLPTLGMPVVADVTIFMSQVLILVNDMVACY